MGVHSNRDRLPTDSSVLHVCMLRRGGSAGAQCSANVYRRIGVITVFGANVRGGTGARSDSAVVQWAVDAEPIAAKRTCQRNLEGDGRTTSLAECRHAQSFPYCCETLVLEVAYLYSRP